MKKIIYFLSLILVVCLFNSCGSPGVNGELIGSRTTIKDWRLPSPAGMVKIPEGSFVMGANGENTPYSSGKKRTLTMSSFWMDQTEITNNEYRQFVHWVRDSIIRKEIYLNYSSESLSDEAAVIAYAYGVHRPIPTWRTDFGEELDFKAPDCSKYENFEQGYCEYVGLDWSHELVNGGLNTLTDEYQTMSRILYMDDDLQMTLDRSEDRQNRRFPHFQHKKIDVTKLAYAWSWINTDMLLSKTELRGSKDKSDKWNRLEVSSMSASTVPVYPDTLAWLKDFTYTFNDPLFSRYFWHPAYGEYPVVGVSWSQAQAFCDWRTALKLSGTDPELRVFETAYRLPTEAEWEYAARGGREQAIYPWGSPYSRNSKGCFLANFKPLRGNYWADGYIYTGRVDSYWKNDFGLYCMSGNVSEWTGSSFNPISDVVISEINPDYQYNANEMDAPTAKRKVVKGGSWKDVAAFLEVGARDYEYQDSARCYIGFRCVKAVGSPKVDITFDEQTAPSIK